MTDKSLNELREEINNLVTDVFAVGKENGYSQGHFKCKECSSVSPEEYRIAITEATEFGRRQGMEDAWKCARLIVNELPAKTLLSVFGAESSSEVLTLWVPEDAINKLIAWKKSEEERDCDHCSRTFGTLGCCDTDNNKWIYHCTEGKKEYAEQHADKKMRTSDDHEVSYTDYANARSTIEDLISRGCSVEMLSKILSQVTSRIQ